MFGNIAVEGFRGIDGLRLENLSRINLIVGPGGVGKTSLLEAFFLLSGAGNARLLLENLGQRGTPPSGAASHVIDMIDWYFSGNDRDEFSLRGAWNGALRNLVVRRDKSRTSIALDSEKGKAQDTVLARYRFETKHGSKTDVGTLVVTPKKLHVANPNSDVEYPCRYEGVASHRSPTTALAPMWTKVEERGDEEAVVRMLRNLVPSVTGVRIGAREDRQAFVRVLHSELGSIPAEILGDGFSKALTIGSHMAWTAGGLLLIDEIDVSLHTGALRSVLRFVVESARDLDVQIVATTHNLEAVDALIEVCQEANDLRIIQFGARTKTKKARVLDANEAAELRDSIGLDLRRSA